jgi:hypothetical protein
MDVVMVGALVLIGILAVSLGWVVQEALVGTPTILPGKLESSLSRRPEEL